MRRLSQIASLEGRAALVTGGAGHLGRVACHVLAELGARVAVLDLDEAACRRVAGELERDHGRPGLVLTLDLSRQEDVARAPGLVAKSLGRLDVLVNCAALVGTSSLKGWAAPFAEQSPEAWRLALEVNLTAPVFLVQACAGLLAASGTGSVINISSIYGLVGPDLRLYQGTAMGNPAAYAATKGGLVQMTRWLATTLAPRVRVNAISLGGVERGQPAAFQERYVRRTPLGRMAAEEDMAGAVAYLASDLSAYVTGHNLIVDGGWTAW